MNRDDFLAELRTALRGLPAAEIDEIVADYSAHFSEGRAAGRNDAEVAAALGDPARLARELRTESGLKRWQSRRTPANYFAAIVAVCGLVAVDLIILLPVLFVLGVIAFVIGVVVFALVVAGLALFASPLWAPSFESWNRTASVILAGVGLVTGGIGAGALLLLGLEGVLAILTSYARLHYQIIKPADGLT